MTALPLKGDTLNVAIPVEFARLMTNALAPPGIPSMAESAVLFGANWTTETVAAGLPPANDAGPAAIPAATTAKEVPPMTTRLDTCMIPPPRRHTEVAAEPAAGFTSRGP